MGIPSYFSYIIKNHHKIIKEKHQDSIHELYFDSNSIIYDSIRKILKKEKVQLQLQHKDLYYTIHHTNPDEATINRVNKIFK